MRLSRRSERSQPFGSVLIWFLVVALGVRIVLGTQGIRKGQTAAERHEPIKPPALMGDDGFSIQNIEVSDSPVNVCRREPSGEQACIPLTAAGRFLKFRHGALPNNFLSGGRNQAWGELQKRFAGFFIRWNWQRFLPSFERDVCSPDRYDPCRSLTLIGSPKTKLSGDNRIYADDDPSPLSSYHRLNTCLRSLRLALYLQQSKDCHDDAANAHQNECAVEPNRSLVIRVLFWGSDDPYFIWFFFGGIAMECCTVFLLYRDRRSLWGWMFAFTCLLCIARFGSAL